SIILQVIGDTEKIDALEKLLRQFGVKEFVRTGTVGILRGPKTVSGGK
ncbi:MAG: acetolactate synthase small subunit, partial [Methanomicrobiales archaeon HGW-Methanomicrobiales-5]